MTTTGGSKAKNGCPINLKTILLLSFCEGWIIALGWAAFILASYNPRRTKHIFVIAHWQKQPEIASRDVFLQPFTWNNWSAFQLRPLLFINPLVWQFLPIVFNGDFHSFSFAIWLCYRDWVHPAIFLGCKMTLCHFPLIMARKIACQTMVKLDMLLMSCDTLPH